MATIPPTGSPQDGATVRRATPAFIDEGHLIGSRYEVRRLLGRGAMGEVWLAFDLKLRVEVALKDLTFRRDDREMIRREVRSARDVVSPNVCRVFDLVEADGRELLSMEFIDGMTLRQVIEERSPLDLSEAQTIASQLLAGLESIHAAGLVHRDLKPENVMITRTGRVVIMDFGLARESKSDSASIAGTPAYMSPEQARGDPMDPRTDIFAVGVLLAELVTAARTREARASIWEGIRQRPAHIPEGPWAAALRKAVSRDRGERYESARAMARALEEVTLRVAAAEDKQPYPGLSAFTRQQSEFFFGREAEVESMLRKLERFHLLALIGPSGAGKSSFIQAGVLPMLPKSWDALLCHPGSSPFVSLGEALAVHLAGEAVPELLRFQELDTAVALFRRWRARHDQVLIVIDQFEELFTLNPVEVQARFAELIGRIVIDADVHVLLPLRDDFLIRCHDFSALEPVLSDLTALSAPAGAALRRAVVQPALRCGYRFEDESLIEAMLAQVGEERGTLPLLAFAASQLWEKRDREGGLLTWRAYNETGGVSGALAKHAEAVLGRIGIGHVSTVREIFRNLVTAEGTRAARDRNELLSVFSSSEAASKVLEILIDARLLTSYEEGRVEIVHESLLTAWPRLVHWRAQDAEGALLRDHLRQAARLWDERGRPSALLWSGSAYREFSVWRERYSGALSTGEEAFARAMVAHAERTRRRARATFATVLAIALAVGATMLVLWRRSAEESRRAEAQKLLAFAQVELERYPTAALAYTIKSLDIRDTAEARRLLIDVLWRGPVARILQLKPAFAVNVEFSPDGKSLAALGDHGPDFLVPQDGGEPRMLDLRNARVFNTRFSDDGQFLVTGTGPEITVVSVAKGQIARTIQKGRGIFKVSGSRILAESRVREGMPDLRAWPLDGGDDILLGSFRSSAFQDIHPSGAWIAQVIDDAIYRQPVNGGTKTADILWRPQRKPLDVNFDRTGEFLAATNDGGFELWSVRDRRTRWLPVPGENPRGLIGPLDFNPSRVVGATLGNSPRIWMWDLKDVPDAEALTLRAFGSFIVNDAALHPTGHWLAISTNEGIHFFWPLNQPRARVLRIRESAGGVLRFSPDSRLLASCLEGDGLRLWSLDTAKESRVAFPPKDLCETVVFDPTGRTLIAAGYNQGVFLHGVEGGPTQQIKETPSAAGLASAFHPSGRTAAVHVISMQDRSKNVLDIVDVASGRIRSSFPTSIRGSDGSYKSSIRWNSLAFSENGTLYSAGFGGIWRWDLERGTRHFIERHPSRSVEMAVSANGRWMLAAIGEDGPSMTGAELVMIDLQNGARHRITTHGSDFSSLAIDASGKVIVTADLKGVVRVGKASGEEPHLLIGNGSASTSVAISPDRRWIASTTQDEIRLWPMPDLSEPPLHTLPHAALMSRLRNLTNLVAVPDNSSSTGYKLEIGRFPGWKDAPTW